MLNSKQTAQILKNRERIRHGRLRTVTLIRDSDGTTSYAAAQCTWKEEHNAPPGAANRRDHSRGSGPDVTAEFAPDVDLSTVVAIADTPDGSQVADARKYRVQGFLRLGLTGCAKPHSRQACSNKVSAHAHRR